MNYLEPLNEQQREAVLHFGSPLLILAGAGSGKTRVITTKIAYLLDEKHVDPRSILAVTFTNKAANEMKNRVLNMTEKGREVMIRTFHSFGAWLLRRYAEPAGLPVNFTIYDEDDKLALLKSLSPCKLEKSELRLYAHLISRLKDKGLLPGDIERSTEYDNEFKIMYRLYHDKLNEIGNVDFGDLILRPLRLLKENPDLKTRLQRRFDIILVDEFQDSNGAQLEMLQELYNGDNYLCVVGDEDQSIYSFRGALVQNIVEFPNVFTGTKVIMLEQNYRSTQNILELAQKVVNKNQYRLGKNLWTENEKGPVIVFALVYDQDEEAQFCAKILEDRIFESTAILYRNNFQSRSFESLFLRLNIPYKIVGTLRFYEREEIKDALSYLSFIANPKDEVAFRRIVNKPCRGVGEKSLNAILSCPEADLIESCRNSLDKLSKKAREGVEYFIKIIEEINEIIESHTLFETVNLLLIRSGLFDYYKEADETESTAKIENLNELLNAVSQFPQGREGLTSFLETTLLNSSDEDPYSTEGKVTLITVHNTKGLEFDRVIITGLEDELFPHLPETFEKYGEELEEERRLFYVGVTRARQKLYLTSCKNRLQYGQYKPRDVSRFIKELPKNLLTKYSEKNDIDGFERGDRVVHHEYGEGTVTHKWINEGEEFVLVKFTNGKQAQFLTKYTKLEKVE
jgi:DNA helicase-2/ATP-dependent DNA helicase PcrA